MGFFKKMGQCWPPLVYFRYFLDTISIIQIEKSVDGVLGIRTQGHRMVGTDKTTELWQPLCYYMLLKASSHKLLRPKCAVQKNIKFLISAEMQQSAAAARVKCSLCE